MLEKLFIAKSGQSSGEWLPLWMHLEDTAGIMKKLLKDFGDRSGVEDIENFANVVAAAKHGGGNLIHIIEKKC